MSDNELAPWEKDGGTPEEWKASNQAIVAEFRANGGKVGGDYAWADLFLLTTTGARNGQPHTVPLAYMREGGHLLVSSLVETSYPAWYHNLRANLAVTIEVGTESYAATASIPTGAARDRLWGRATDTWPLLIEHQATTALPAPIVVLQRQSVQ
jgi:deazaflavin-dependent oxidoreductase (nitroreductase family)